MRIYRGGMRSDVLLGDDIDDAWPEAEIILSELEESCTLDTRPPETNDRRPE